MSRRQYILQMHTFPYSLRLHHNHHRNHHGEDASGFVDHFRPVQEKVIEGGGTPNIPGLSGGFVIPSLCQDFCCEIVASCACHRLVGVGIDPEFGCVHVCRRGSPGFDEVVCHAIVDCRMAQGQGAKGER